MPDKTWKEAERQVARRFGTERTGPLGEEWPDAVSQAYSIEVKHRRQLPQWLKEAVAQAQENGRLRAPHHLPIVVLHEYGGEYDDCLVIVPTLAQFVEWFGT